MFFSTRTEPWAFFRYIYHIAGGWLMFLNTSRSVCSCVVFPFMWQYAFRTAPLTILSLWYDGLKKVWSAHRRIPGAALGFDVSLSRYWDFFLRGRERHRAWEYNWSGISLSTGAPGPSVLGTLPTGLATRNVLPRCSDVWPRIKEGRTYSPAASLLRYTLLKLSGVDWMSRHRPRGEMEERRELGRPVLNKEGRKMDWKQRTSSPR